MASNRKEHSIIWFISIIALIAFTNLAVFLDVPFLRPLLGGIFLTVIPGLLLLFLLRLNHLGIAEKLVLTVGMSVTFLMIFVWILNQASIAAGYMTPLSTPFLILSLSLALVVLLIIAYLTNKEAFSPASFHLELNTRSKLCLLPPLLLPVLSIFGTRIMNISGNNAALMIMLFLIPFSVILLVWQRHKILPDTYPVAIVVIALALLIMYWLRSDYILGHDVHYEYYFFQKVLQNQQWRIFEYSTLNSCLGSSLLPAIYQSVLHVDAQEQLFKGLYTMVCAFTPLGIYIITRRYIGESFAFLAAIFYTSQGYFLGVPGNPRISLAFLFFSLSIMVLFHDGIPGIMRKGLFIAFMIATIVSHYTTAYVFFFLILFTVSIVLILGKRVPSKSLTVTSLVLFFALIFFWYSQLTEASFISGVDFVKGTIISLTELAAIESRSTGALTIIGGGTMADNPALAWAHFFLTWCSFALIATGVMGTLIKRKGTLSTPQWQNPISLPLKAKFEVEFFLLALACSALLVAVVAIPKITFYDPVRFYTQTAVILSTFFVLGCIILARLWRISPYLIVLAVLVPYFLFNTGTLYETFGIHDKTWLLSVESPAYRYEFIHEQEVPAAKWLGEHKDNSLIYVFEDYAPDKLISQGGITIRLRGLDLIDYYPPPEDQREPKDKYFFLTYDNVVNGEFASGGKFFSMSQFSEVLASQNVVYANGGSEIYR